MFETKLSPIEDRPIYSDIIFKQIRYDFYVQVFKPLFEILGATIDKQRTVVNSKFDLINAIVTGRIQYRSGYFTGRFNALISRELVKLGAKYDIRKRAYKMEVQNIPSDIMRAISQGDTDLERKLLQVNEKLNDLSSKKISQPQIDAHLEGVIKDLNKRSHTTFPSSVEVPMQLSVFIAERLKSEYKENLDLSIQGWYDNAILRLREKVQQNVAIGFRADKLAEDIKYEYGVTERKALFIAKQETSLFVSKYRENRYGEVGIVEYVWSTSHDERVRPAGGKHGVTNNHRVLDGKRFRFSDPPIVDTAKGRRANPGEDFGCRCVAIPVLLKKG